MPWWTAVRRTEPLYDITTPDGIVHTVWRIADPAMIASLIELFRGVAALYIADGHHRTASAVRYGQACRARNPQPNRQRAVRVLHGRGLSP